jgi:hypothetical protein
MTVRPTTLLLLAALSGARALAAQPCAPGAPVAIVGADVLTMESPTLLRGQTVLVRDGRIAAMGATAVPADACRIDARGRVLLPGLADMHAHTSEREMPLFLANGVTLVREMNGTPAHVALRERLARGEVAGPRLLVASPLLVGTPLRYRHRLIRSSSDAYKAAHEAKDAGYDFLKVYDGLTAEQYAALVEAGRTLGLPLDGHVPADAGLAGVLASGQAIQHMDKVAFALLGHDPDTARVEAYLAEARRLFAGRRTWVTPTLASLRALDRAGTTEYAERLRRPEMTYVDTASLAWWRSLERGGRRAPAASPVYRFEQRLLGVLRESGARLLVGTDAANPLMIAGFSVHDELATLVADGGLSPWDALRAATRDAAEFLGDSTGGVVRVGARADLLLVDGDPLADLSTLRRPRGVMVGGRWHDRAALDAGLAVLRPVVRRAATR